MILIILLPTMGIFQYISMKDYLYKTKAQVLHERFHNLDFSSVPKENIKNGITESDSQKILKNLWDKSMSVAIIDKNGDLLGERSNADIPIENNDWDSDTKEPTKLKINAIPVPVLSKEHYISICNKEGNLDATYEIVKDENNNYQMVAWIKVGDLNSPSGLIQLSTPIDDIAAILDQCRYMCILVFQY